MTIGQLQSAVSEELQSGIAHKQEEKLLTDFFGIDQCAEIFVPIQREAQDVLHKVVHALRERFRTEPGGRCACSHQGKELQSAHHKKEDQTGDDVIPMHASKYGIDPHEAIDWGKEGMEAVFWKLHERE